MRKLGLLTALTLLLGANMVMAAESLQVRLLTSRLTPYLGEEVVLTLEVEHSARSHNGVVPLWGALDGVIASPPAPVSVRRSQRRSPEMIIESLQRNIRPIRSGPLPLTVAARPSYGQTVKAARLTLQVLPLPLKGQPPGYQGVVGTPELELQRPTAGQLELTIRGPYDLAAFPLPTVVPGSSKLRLVSDRSSGQSPGIRQRVLTYVIDPDLATSRLGFFYDCFDPARQSYRRLGIGNISPAEIGWPLPLAVLGTLLLCAGALIRYRRRQSLRRAWIRKRPEETLETYLLRLSAAGASQASLQQVSTSWLDFQRRFAPKGLPSGEEMADRLKSRLLAEIDKQRPFEHYRHTRLEFSGPGNKTDRDRGN